MEENLISGKMKLKLAANQLRHRVLGLFGVAVLLLLILPVSLGHMSSESTTGGLGLAVYVPGPYFQGIKPLMQQYVVYPSDMLVYLPWENSAFPTVIHTSGGTSLARVQNATNVAPHYGSKVIGYDFEHWAKTPAAEQADPVGSVDKASSIVHLASLKFMFNPDGYFLSDLSNGIPYYKLYHWKNVDYLLMQYQSHKFAGWPTGTNITAFDINVQNVVNYAKSQNPKIIIFEQLSLRDDSVSTIISKTASISNIVNGVSYYYTGNQTLCASCTPTNLQALLTSLRPTL